jgi:hypothetical protein
MRNLIQIRFLRLLFTGILLLLVSVLNSPIAAAQNQGVVKCRIARSITLYEQPSETAKQTARVRVKQGESAQLVLAEGNGNETWLHVARVDYGSGRPEPLSGYAFNDLKATPLLSRWNAIVACVVYQPNNGERPDNSGRPQGRSKPKKP